MVFDVIAFVAAAIGGLILLLGLAGSNGAPQEAAVCAIALAIAGIPYFVASLVQRRRILAKLEALDRQP